MASQTYTLRSPARPGPAGAFFLSRRAHHLRMFGLLLATLLLIYGPAFILYYSLLDDNWIIQSYAHPRWRQFAAEIIATQQGRPLFAAMIVGTGLLAAKMGIVAMSLVRFVATVNLAVAMFLVCRWVTIWGLSPTAAALFSLALATLPAYQMYVTGGPWLTVPLVMSIAAVHIVYRSCRPGCSTPRRIAMNGCAAILFVASLASYQPVPMILFAMLIWPLLAVEIDRREADVSIKVVATTLTTMLLALGAYYVTWRIVYQHVFPGSQEARYSPTAWHFSTMLSNLDGVLQSHIPTMARLWSVMNIDADPRAGAQRILAAVITVALIGWLAQAGREFDRTRRLACFLRIGLRFVAALLFVVLGDTAVLASPQYVGSYMSAGAIAFAIVSVLVLSGQSILALSGKRLEDRLLVFGLAVAVAFGVFRAQSTVVKHFAVPLTMEYRLVRNQIRDEAQHHSICGIRFLQSARPLLGLGYSEFAYSNINSGFFSRRMIEDILDELKLPRVRIESVEAAGGTTDADPKDPPASPTCDSLTIDMTSLNLR